MIRWKIISGPINSGKTTFASAYIDEHAEVAGIICPKRDGFRFLQLIDDHKMYKLDAFINPNTTAEQNTLNVGRYTFDKGVFLLAKAYLSELKYKEFDTLMIDEIGKLELAGDGYEPELSILLAPLDQEVKVYEVVVVVRDYLLQDFMVKYKIEKYHLLKN